MNKSYSELMRLSTFEERLEYLKLSSIIGDVTFGFDRYANQMLYHSNEWKRVRKKVIERDCCCDIGFPDREIQSSPVIHHINPISMKDIEEGSYSLFDMNNLITVSDDTHKYIHYGTELKTRNGIVERKANDTCPWRNNNG